MDMNLRKDGYFVQDSAWYEAERCFGDFVSRSLDRKLVLLELGGWIQHANHNPISF